MPIKMPKNDFTRKMTPLQNLPKNVGDLCKLIVAIGFKKLPKIQNLVTLIVDEKHRRS